LRATLLDAGPVIGLLYRPDPHREACVQALRASLSLAHTPAVTVV
jgi:hypothetical protein